MSDGQRYMVCRQRGGHAKVTPADAPGTGVESSGR